MVMAATPCRRLALCRHHHLQFVHTLLEFDHPANLEADHQNARAVAKTPKGHREANSISRSTAAAIPASTSSENGGIRLRHRGVPVPRSGHKRQQFAPVRCE